MDLADDVRPEDSASQAGSRHSADTARSVSSSTKRCQVLAKRAALESRRKFLEQQMTLELEELKLKQRVDKLNYEMELAAVDAEAAVLSNSVDQLEAVSPTESDPEITLHPRYLGSTADASRDALRCHSGIAGATTTSRGHYSPTSRTNIVI